MQGSTYDDFWSVRFSIQFRTFPLNNTFKPGYMFCILTLISGGVSRLEVSKEDGGLHRALFCTHNRERDFGSNPAAWRNITNAL